MRFYASDAFRAERAPTIALARRASANYRHTSSPSHAHPPPARHVRDAEMHASPHAWLRLHTLQHSSRGMQPASRSAQSGSPRPLSDSLGTSIAG